MIENTPHNEGLDNYLLGELSPDAHAAMEAKLAADNQLQEEMLLQRDIVQALQETRRLELKARLNAVEVGAGGFSSAAGLKLAAGVALIGLMGTGIFLYFNQATPEETSLAGDKIELAEYTTGYSYTVPAIPEVSTEVNSAPAATAEPLALNHLETAPATTAAVVSSHNAAVRKETVTATPAEVQESNRKEIQVQKPSIVSGFGDAEFTAGTEQADMPVDAMSRNGQFTNKSIEVNAQPHDKYNFHYQFYDNRLYIFGEFNNKPYEILEINTEGTTSYFLYFENNYYGLKENQQKLTRLRRITNEKLIEELEVTRTEK